MKTAAEEELDLRPSGLLPAAYSAGARATRQK